MGRFVFPAILALALPLLAGGDSQPAKRLPPYVHSVIVYLKKDVPQEKVNALLVDCREVLGKIPTVRSLWVGRPAEKGSPQFAVTDFHIGLLMLFDNYDGLKAYIDHPTHLKFVDTYMPIVEKIQVYDFEHQAK